MAYKRRTSVRRRRRGVGSVARASGRQSRARSGVLARRRVIRRRTRRFKRAGKPRMVLYKNLVKEKCLTNLRYCDTKQLTPGTTKSTHSFRLNDLNDPDVTGLGHKPSYITEWTRLYNQYRVISAKWKITFQPYRAATKNTYIANDGVDYPFSDSTHYDMVHSGHIVAWELNNTNLSRLNEASDKNFLRETGKDMDGTAWTYLHLSNATLKGRGSMRYLLSDPKDANTATALGSSPAAQMFLLVTALSKDSFAAQNVRFDITIDYLVEFSDPIQIGES